MSVRGDFDGHVRCRRGGVHNVSILARSSSSRCCVLAGIPNHVRLRALCGGRRTRAAAMSGVELDTCRAACVRDVNASLSSSKTRNTYSDVSNAGCGCRLRERGKRSCTAAFRLYRSTFGKQSQERPSTFRLARTVSSASRGTSGAANRRPPPLAQLAGSSTRAGRRRLRAIAAGRRR